MDFPTTTLMLALGAIGGVMFANNFSGFTASKKLQVASKKNTLENYFDLINSTNDQKTKQAIAAAMLADYGVELKK